MGDVEIQLPEGCLVEDPSCTATAAISRENIPVKCALDMGPLGKCTVAMMVSFRNSTIGTIVNRPNRENCLEVKLSKAKDAPDQTGDRGKKKGKGKWW